MRASNARPYGIACTSDDNVGATIGRPLLAAGAMRLEIVPIHLLRQHGYESAEETVVCGRPTVAPTMLPEQLTNFVLAGCAADMVLTAPSIP